MKPPILVFVVEDEALISEVLIEALHDGGFDVATVSSGEDAVRLLEASGAEHGALVTDINLSGTLTGYDVAKRARELNPSVPIVYMTGGGSDGWKVNGVPGSLLIAKPFAPAQIVTAVAQLLNKEVGSG